MLVKCFSQDMQSPEMENSDQRQLFFKKTPQKSSSFLNDLKLLALSPSILIAIDMDHSIF